MMSILQPPPGKDMFDPPQTLTVPTAFPFGKQSFIVYIASTDEFGAIVELCMICPFTTIFIKYKSPLHDPVAAPELTVTLPV